LKRFGLLLGLALLAACGPDRRSAAVEPTTELEAAVRRYYIVFDQVRATGEASLLEELTAADGFDRANVQALVLEQRSRRKFAVITREQFANWKFSLSGDTAVVSFDYIATGYDVDALTGHHLEAETTLPADRVRMELRRQSGRWLVFSRARA
jgi:hypothetical protein